MTIINYESVDFPNPLPMGLQVPKKGAHPIRPARLAWAAATIGYSPYGPAASRRVSDLELQWRTAMIRASLSRHHRTFCRSESYQKLDSSEKGAISFFLGQAQAKLFAHDMFRVSRFVHYDKYLQHVGAPRSKTRPDFLGFRQGGAAIAVEAKGRSGMWDKALVESARKQAQSLPTITGYSNQVRYAHIAFFNHDDWEARLIAPPAQPSTASVDPTYLTLAYYEPIVTAILNVETEREVIELRDGERYSRASFPHIDANILVREDIVIHTVEALRELQVTEKARPSRAASLLYESMLRIGSTKFDVDWRDTESFFLGGDGVGIELGSSWENWTSP